jgi:hypothetical protein
METDMGGSKFVVAIVCVAACGAAAAQQVVTKPAPSRFYGTARPPVISGPAAVPPSVVHVPPPVMRPPTSVYVPPPRPVHGYGHGYGYGYGYGWAPRPRVGVDVWIGPGTYWYGSRYAYPGWAYPPPYPSTVYVPPPVVVSPPPPIVWVERPPEQAAPAAPVPGFWYWCAESQGWYPQVPECPAGWLQVAPRADAQ